MKKEVQSTKQAGREKLNLFKLPFGHVAVKDGTMIALDGRRNSSELEVAHTVFECFEKGEDRPKS